MKKVPAHIQIQGVPLCVCKDHLLGTKTPDDEWITCGFASLADAQRVKIHLQKRNHSVRVVRGECQAFWGDEA
jgi:hypothetical protein|tara:strand:+ start:224 stop:442 length:219 start_codon:yes stop_codon:yes gene_type:complete